MLKYTNGDLSNIWIARLKLTKGEIFMPHSTNNTTVSEERKRIWTVPNVLSFIRLALIPVICVFYLVKHDGILAAGVLVLSGLTDVVDGFIARRFNMVSDLGKALDPVADKLTQGVVLLCLVGKHPHILIIVALLLVKEIITGAVNLHVAKKTGIVNSAEWHGKATTVVLFATIFLHLVWYDITPKVSYISSIACVVVMLISFTLYSVKNKRLLKDFDRKTKK